MPENWLKGLKARVRFQEPLSNHTTLGVGGPADLWIEPQDVEQLRKIIRYCRELRLPYLVIGKGSNILFSDKGFAGVLICLNSEAFTRIEIEGDCISSAAGAPLNNLINQARTCGLGGLEFLAGIPATCGGALMMNAGNRKEHIGSLVKSVTVMDGKGEIRRLNKKQLRFGYRHTNLNRYIVLEAQLRLVKRNPKKIKENIARFLEQKRRTQDLAVKSAGCIFRNPRHRLSAAEMIAACGLKRRRKGGAEISGKHANFIINRNSARAQDILYLIDLAQEKVKEGFAVCLQPEVKIIK